MTYNNLKIPEKNGELLCIPSLNLISQLIKSNKERFKSYNFTIGYEDYRNFRNAVRKKVIRLSEKFTANLGIKSRIYNNSDTIIQTGHQPIFYHPGIIIKNLILNKIGMMEGINAINLIVDTDNFKEIAVNTQDCRDGIVIERETLLSNQHPIPYEFSVPPSREAFDSFIEGIKNRLSHPYFKNLYYNFNRYRNKISHIKKDFKTLSEFMTVIRRIYEEEIESKYLEVPLSYICDTDEFLLFFLSIAIESERFALIYNCRLERYRKEHKFRYPANPFPNLKIKGKKIELPFWYFHNDKRYEIFIEFNIDTVNIFLGGEREISLKKERMDEGIEIFKKNNIKIRPKAIILTLFNRMFVSDAFIHGIGGAKYDRITDNIIRDFYNVEPPEFITASLTLYPSVNFPVENLQGKIKELENKLRDMRYNPEKYVIPPLPLFLKGGGGDLIKEKENLLSLLKADNANKKEISIKLKEINEVIYQKIKPSVEDAEKEIKTAKKRQEGLSIIQRRDYPYFLFSPGEIMRTISKLMGNQCK